MTLFLFYPAAAALLVGGLALLDYLTGWLTPERLRRGWRL